MQISVVHVATLLFVLIFGYTNCGRFKSAADSGGFGEFSSLGCEAPLAQSFNRTFYPFFKTSNCSMCHNTAQNNIPGDFADADFNKAFSAFMIEGYATNNSRMQTLAFNATHDHQGAGKAEYTARVQGFVSEINKAADRAAACDGARSGGGFITSAAIVPDSGKGSLTFSLDSVTPAFTSGGASLSVQAEVYTDPTGNEALLLSQPTLKAGSKDLAVREIYVKMNGLAMPLATTFSEIDSSIPAQQTQPLLPIDRSSLILPISAGQKGMSIQLVITYLK